MAADMLVKLYEQKPDYALFERLAESGVKLARVLSPDKAKVLSFVRENFTEAWVNECEAAFANNPISCYIAVRDKKIVGFAAYDATAKNFFGPTGVLPETRGTGIGRALLNKCLISMQEDGYGYAAIGWCDHAAGFYEKCCGAVLIPDSSPGVYGRLVDIDTVLE